MDIFNILVLASLVGQIVLLTTSPKIMVQKIICIITTTTLLWISFTDMALSLPAVFALVGFLLCIFKTTIGECWRVIGWYSIVIFVLYLLTNSKEDVLVI